MKTKQYGCLLPNEEIIIEDGLKKIIDINVGDTVMTHTGEFVKVTKIWNFNKPVYYVTFINGEHIECSNTHRLLVNKSKIDKESSWKTIQELHDGDVIYMVNIVNETGIIQYKSMKISRIFKSGNDDTPVCDLTVEGSNTYISANGVINHSF